MGSGDGLCAAAVGPPTCCALIPANVGRHRAATAVVDHRYRRWSRASDSNAGATWHVAIGRTGWAPRLGLCGVKGPRPGGLGQGRGHYIRPRRLGCVRHRSGLLCQAAKVGPVQKRTGFPFVAKPAPASARIHQLCAVKLPNLNRNVVRAWPAFERLAFDPAGKLRGGHVACPVVAPADIKSSASAAASATALCGVGRRSSRASHWQ